MLTNCLYIHEKHKTALRRFCASSWICSKANLRVFSVYSVEKSCQYHSQPTKGVEPSRQDDNSYLVTETVGIFLVWKMGG